MAYTYEQILAVDPANPANVARAASITIFAPGDAAKTPLTITDTNGAALPNPLTSNANGFAPAFIHATLDRVAWEGGGLTGFLTSYEGMKEEAVAARAAAESAASTAGADAAAVADAAIGDATEASEAAAASAATAEANAAASATAAANSAALVGAPADTAIAAAINGNGATKTALNGAYVTPATTAQTEGLLRQDALKASHDRGRSAGLAVVASQDSEQFVEQWANHTAWAHGTNPNLQVVGGKAYRQSGGTGPAGKTFPITSGERVRMVATIQVAAAGSGAGWVFVGLSSDAAGAVPTAANMRAIGINPATNEPTAWNGAAVNLSTTPLAAGTYYVTVTSGPLWVSFTLSNADRSVEYRYQIAAAAFNNICLWVYDTRNELGSGIGKLGIKRTHATITPPTGVETGPSSYYGTSGSGTGANKLRVVMPAGYDSRKGAPLALYFHGLGGDALEPYTAVGKEFERALTNAGYIFAASDGFNINSFGHINSQNEYVKAYQSIRDNYNINGVVLVGASMGTLAALNIVAKRLIPGVAAMAFSYPLTSLQWAWDSPNNWKLSIRANFGMTAPDDSDYAVKTAGADPMLRDGKEFSGIPMKFWHSAADTVVNKAANSDAFVAKVLPYVPEATVVTTTGEHGSSSNFTTTENNALVAFLNKYLNR